MWTRWSACPWGSATRGEAQLGEWTSAGVHNFSIVVRASGGHGAYPQRTADPITIAAQLINAVNPIRARRVDPLLPAVISLGSIHSGQTHNVIPSELTTSGTVRHWTGRPSE